MGRVETQPATKAHAARTRIELQVFMGFLMVGGWLDDIFFPPTPALSPGEKENRPPSLRHTRDGVCQASVRDTRASPSCPLSPRERVRVRGNDSLPYFC